MMKFYFLQKDYDNANVYYEKALDVFPAANSANQKLEEIKQLQAD